MGSRQRTRQEHVTVITNDPDNRSVRLTVSADVMVILATDPVSVNLGSIEKGSSVERYISLTGRDRDEAKITSVETRFGNYIKTELSHEGFKNAPNKQIKVTLHPDIPLGRFRERIIITTDHEQVPQILVNVFGDITGGLLVTPRNLSFGIFDRGQEVVRTVDVKTRSDNPFRIKKVTSNVPGLVTDVKTIEEGKHYEIIARTRKNLQGDVLRGELVIETDNPAESTISVRVFGRVKRD